MTSSELVQFYERDLQKVIEEVNLFRKEEHLWKTQGSIKNSAGNLALHLTGGLNFLIGTTLGNTGYIRNRDLEFSIKGVERALIVQQLQELIEMIRKTISSITRDQLDEPFPIFFDKEGATADYVLTQLLLHINYHLGQINYLRRCLE
jgi:hypothetical protein